MNRRAPRVVCFAAAPADQIADGERDRTYEETLEMT